MCIRSRFIRKEVLAINIIAMAGCMNSIKESARCELYSEKVEFRIIPPTMANKISLDERYTFVKQAGQGTYGTTWIAEDAVTGKTVIIKAISKANTSRSDFKRELKYAKYLSLIHI